MKNIPQRLLITAVLVSFPLLFSGCKEDLQKTYEAAKKIVLETFNIAQGEMTKAINPLPTCSDPEVILEVNKKLTDHALYGTHALLKYGTIVHSGTNENTDEVFCKGVVTYSIDKKDNKVSSFLSKIPIIKDVSKDRTIDYSIVRKKDKKNFKVKIH